ncbi:hypothetical protein ACWEQ3_47480 [Streptomyces mirabilis]
MVITAVVEVDRTCHRFDPDTPLPPDQLTPPEKALDAARTWLRWQPAYASAG